MSSKRRKEKTTLLVGGQSAKHSTKSIDLHELEFYGSLVERFRAVASQSLLNKRAAIAKEDPTQELIEVHFEVQELEREFKECVEIAAVMLTKTRELDENIRDMDQKNKSKGQLGERSA